MKIDDTAKKIKIIERIITVVITVIAVALGIFVTLGLETIYGMIDTGDDTMDLLFKNVIVVTSFFTGMGLFLGPYTLHGIICKFLVNRYSSSTIHARSKLNDVIN